MPERVKVRVFINRGKLASLNFPGGDIYSFGRDFARQVAGVAVLYCPKRTEHLATTIRADAVGSNQYGINCRVSAGAYALFVHDGTAGGKAGRIYPKKKPRLFVHPPWGQYGASRQEFVTGQDPNPFLRRALDHAVKTSPHIT